MDMEAKVVADLQERIRRLERIIATMQAAEVAGGGPISEANVSNPPTDAQLDSAFGAPANISEGMLKWIDDNGAATAVWGAVPINGAWWYWSLTKAV